MPFKMIIFLLYQSLQKGSLNRVFTYLTITRKLVNQVWPYQEHKHPNTEYPYIYRFSIHLISICKEPHNIKVSYPKNKLLFGYD